LEGKNPLVWKAWSPYWVGALIGVLSWFAFASAQHPIGISTALEHTSALLTKGVPGACQPQAYLAEKQKEGKPPKIDWEWMLVVGVFLGAYLSSQLSGDRTSEQVPALWQARFGPQILPRYPAAFFGGTILFGVGMAVLGHGPGTTLAAYGEGRRDARVGLVGMILGAAAYVWSYGPLRVWAAQFGDGGKVTVPQVTHTSLWLWIAVLAVLLVVGATLLERRYSAKNATEQERTI